LKITNSSKIFKDTRFSKGDGKFLPLKNVSGFSLEQNLIRMKNKNF